MKQYAEMHLHMLDLRMLSLVSHCRIATLLAFVQPAKPFNATHLVQIGGTCR